MPEIFAWTPIVWLGRITVALLLGTVMLLAFSLASAVVARLVRPANLRAIVAGDVPAAVRGIKARFGLFGQELEVDAKIDMKRDDQFLAIGHRVTHLEEAVKIHNSLLEDLLDPADVTRRP
ncbi:MAG: hypothetical protein ACREM1_16455 [Longimicrobiales bacterium]